MEGLVQFKEILHTSLGMSLAQPGEYAAHGFTIDIEG